MIFVFGDSFARVFSLFKESNVQVYAYKGATLKGLAKPTNENRLAIERIIKKNKNISCAIFSFGQVDLNLSFYYDVTKNQGKIPFSAAEYYSEYINKYVEWIANLPGRFRIVILTPYPSPLNAEHTINSLINYNSISKEVVEQFQPQLELCAANDARQIRYYEFIYCLQKKCKEGFSSHHLVCINLNKHILNENLVIKNEFYDVSQYNMHLRWGPIIPCILAEFSQFGQLLTKADIVSNLAEIEEKYIKEKTEWLENNKDYWT